MRFGVCLALFACAVSAQPSSGTAEELGRQAKEATAAGNYRAAAEAYRNLEIAAPGIPGARFNLGLMLHLAGDWQGAVETLAPLAKTDRTLFPAYLITGSDLLKLGRAAESVGYLQHALALQPGSVECVLALAGAHSALNHPEAALAAYRRTPEAALTQAGRDADFWSGVGLAAFAVLKKSAAALSAAPAGEPYSRVLLSLGAARRQRWKEAFDEVHQPAQAPPRDLPCLPALARFLAGRVGAAYDGAPPPPSCAAPHNESDWLNWSWTGTAPPSSQAGARELMAALATPPVGGGRPGVLFWRSIAADRLAAFAAGQLNGADNDTRTRLLRADLLRGGESYGKSIADYHAVLASDAKNTAARFGLALALHESQDYESARKEFEEYLRQQPHDARARYLYASTLLACDRPRDAVPQLETALTQTDGEGRPPLHALLSRTYERLGDNGKAIAELKQALPSDTDGTLHYRLAGLYRKSGDVTAAANALAQYREKTVRKQ